MSPLSNQHQQLIFDYCLGLTSQQESTQAEGLISSDKQASEIHSSLETTLSPLKSIETESCPDYLAERTVLRLNNMARSSQQKLEELIAAEQRREVFAGGRLWHNFGQLAAAVAIIVIAVGIWFAPLNFARQKYWQHQCRMQLSSVFKGIDNYIGDHNNEAPAIATAAGEPWWKVGYQGKENYSNTRHMWLLVKDNYVEPADFICPGTKEGRAVRRVIKAAPIDMINTNDFPGREYIRYSVRISCDKAEKRQPPSRKVLMADLNPLFEKLPKNFTNSFKEVRVDKELLTANSINHQRQGQNVLFCDGAVKFVKMRHIGILEDDIFTLRGTKVYKGVEVPSSEADAFLAP
ncbi:MAG: hypothetical protein JXB29_10190 [Sedimentisphaerales bacterium]|nr:hypothetical protein [Sedimentisphaerales bacterium]